MMLTLSELAQRIGARLEPSPNDPEAGGRSVSGCAALDAAGETQVSFLTNPRYADQLADCRAAAIIVGEATPTPGKTRLVADDPYLAFRNAMLELHGWRQPPEVGISKHARIDETAIIGDLCTIGRFAYVDKRARIGKRCILHPGVYVGDSAVLGDDCVLYPNVTIYDGCILGDRVVLHSGCVIGQDGFGYATHDGVHHKIPAAGNVVIENDVEMGACCCVDRATLGSTRIGAGTKFSNAVAIGHGCRIGKANLFVGQVGLAGSVITGDYVVMGGQVGVAGHLKIGDRAQIAGKSGVMTDVPADEKWGGQPAQPLNDAKRAYVQSQRVGELVDRVKKLETTLAQLRSAQQQGQR